MMSDFSKASVYSIRSTVSRWHPNQAQHMGVPPAPPPTMAVSLAADMTKSSRAVSALQAEEYERHAKEFTMTGSKMDLLIDQLLTYIKETPTVQGLNHIPTPAELMTGQFNTFCKGNKCYFMKENEFLCPINPDDLKCAEKFWYSTPPCFRYAPEWNSSTKLENKKDSPQVVRLQTSYYLDYVIERAEADKVACEKLLSNSSVPKNSKEIKRLIHTMWPCNRLKVPQGLLPTRRGSYPKKNIYFKIFSHHHPNTNLNFKKLSNNNNYNKTATSKIHHFIPLLLLVSYLTMIQHILTFVFKELL